MKLNIIVRLADKPWQKVLLADLLWEKNIAEWLLKRTTSLVLLFELTNVVFISPFRNTSLITSEFVGIRTGGHKNVRIQPLLGKNAVKGMPISIIKCFCSTSIWLQ